MNRPKVAVIILNWNNAPDTLDCLSSVYLSSYPHYVVYVADNGSTDGSFEKICDAYPEVKPVINGENLGFAEGNNRAITQAIDEGADFVFLLNNDATIRSDTLELLEEQAQKFPAAAALGPKIYYFNDPSTIWYAGAGWNPDRASFYHVDWNVEEAESQGREAGPTDYICGCALFARVSAIKTVGLMDARFFLNWEEIDWCWRFQKSGYDCIYVPHAKAWHKISRSFIGGKKGPMWLYYYWRGRLLWMEKNLQRKEFFSLFRKIIFPEIKGLIRERFSSQSTYLQKQQARACLKGLTDYLFRRFGFCSSQLLKK